MKKINTLIQSFIDVVTNSSAEIFVEATRTKAHIIRMVNEILKAGGSDKTCDDLFDIQLINSTEKDEWCKDTYIAVTAKNLESIEAAIYLTNLSNFLTLLLNIINNEKLQTLGN